MNCEDGEALQAKTAIIGGTFNLQTSNDSPRESHNQEYSRMKQLRSDHLAKASKSNYPQSAQAENDHGEILKS